MSPTKTWFSLFSRSSNRRVREARSEAGTAQAPIEGLVLDSPGPRRRGRVSLGKDLHYSWNVADAAQVSRLLGLNHDVYVRDLAGKVVLNRIQALMHVSAGPTKATLTVVGGADLLPLIRPGAHPVSVTAFFPMWSRATLGAAPSR